MRHTMLFWVVALVPAVVPSLLAAEPAQVPVGVAVVDITPEYPIRLVGYGAGRRSRRASPAASRPERWRSVA